MAGLSEEKDFVTLRIPSKIISIFSSYGIDIEEALIEYLRRLTSDPDILADLHLSFADKFLNEGENLIEKDAIQASEKLYKAAEEAIKALATKYAKDVLPDVEARGRWTVTDLEKALKFIVRATNNRELASWWDDANYLHVWGFHEAKLDAESIKLRLVNIRKLVEFAKKSTKSEN